MNEKEVEKKVLELSDFIEKKLPDFNKMVMAAITAKDNPEGIVLHQDAFAADYQEDEYILLGKAIKFCGVFGLSVTIIGTNRSTLT